MSYPGKPRFQSGSRFFNGLIETLRLCSAPLEQCVGHGFSRFDQSHPMHSTANVLSEIFAAQCFPYVAVT